MRHPLRHILVATAFVLAALSSVTAFAAPTEWQRVDVTMHPEQNQSVMLIAGELPATVKLPAEAELAVPAGSQLQWIGEILGGASSEDPALTYTKATQGGMDVYRFTLTKSRTAQIEIPVAAGTAFDGTTYTTAIAWTPAQDVPEVRLNLRVPKGAVIATAAAGGGALLPSDSTYSYYSKTVTDAKAGKPLDLSVAYTLPVVAATQGAAAASGTNSLVPFLLVIAAIAGGAALVVAIRRKMAGKTADDYTPPPSSKKVRPAKVASSVDYDDEVESTESPEEAEEPAPGTAGRTKRNLVTLAIIGALVVVAFVVVQQAAKPQATGDTITQTFAAGEACASATITVSVAGDADAQATAEKLFAAIKPIAGVNTATYNAKTSSVNVGFCESQTSEDALKAAIKPTGLLAP